MYKWTQQHMRDVMAAQPGYVGIQVAIETGIFRGQSALDLAGLFREWHAIEIEPGYIELSRRRWAEAGVSNVSTYPGDTRDLLPLLLAKIKEPAVIMLDAHYSAVKRPCFYGEPAMQHRQGADFPLYAELQALAERPYADLILIDDWALAGREAPRVRAPGDRSEQWESLTPEKVCTRLGRVVRCEEWPARTDPAKPNPICALAVWRKAD